MEYLRRIAAVNELKSEDGSVLLNKQYEKLEFVGRDNAMALYLNPKLNIPASYEESDLIFPFGGNASQFKAVKNAMCNQISVIQGPPGTGKTQTILNIVANLLVQGKTVQVVSNNNSATANVLEKLSLMEYGLGFLVAPLGKSANKAEFIRNQTGRYPDLSGWKANEEKQVKLTERIKGISEELEDVFIRQENLAKYRQELEALKLEISHFEKYCEETGLSPVNPKTRKMPRSERLMKMWQECYGFSENDRPVSFWFKVRSVLIHGIADWKSYKGSLTEIVTLYQSLFYKAKKSEIEAEVASLEESLKNSDKKIPGSHLPPAA
jgi:superfamily I DNA and/or RNA helicase